MAGYLEAIYQARYVWIHLALSDLRQKYRRSKLGIAWAVLQPLGMTLLLAYIVGNLFGQSMASYAPYIFSGLIVWEYMVNAAVGGCAAFLVSQSYIKQFTYPYAIYTLRHTLAGAMNFLVASGGLILWCAIMHTERLGISWLTLPLAYLLIFFCAWGVATVCAFIATWFHDFSQMVVLLLQAIWFVSPVFFQAGTFRENRLSYLVDYNPVYHMLELVRAPLLGGHVPTATNYLYAFGLTAGMWLLAALFIRSQEKKLIFYF